MPRESQTRILPTGMQRSSSSSHDRRRVIARPAAPAPLITSGTASMPANSRKSAAFPSMTGNEAFGPLSPRPRTADPSETTATVLPFQVRSQAAPGFSAISSHGRATPGV